MSSSEDVFSNRDLSSRQQNGAILTSKNRPSRATMENIKSVHENPFYKTFGIKHNAPAYPKQVSRSEVLNQRRHVNGRSSSADDDDIGEYRPGSGYVHKLLDKFTSLTAREEHSVSIAHLKRSSSLDELPVENEAAVSKPPAPRAMSPKTTFEKPSSLSVAKLSLRARSIESLNHSHHKSHHNNAISSQHIETKREMNKLGSPKMKRDTAPEVLAKDDIVLVENSQSISSAAENSDCENDDGSLKIGANRDIVFHNEMPRPNTVLTVRSIFESASSSSGLYSKRHRSDSPSSPSSVSAKSSLSPLQTVPSISNQDSLLNRTGVRSPSPITSPRLSNEAPVKPVLPPTNSYASKSDIRTSAVTVSSSSGTDNSRSLFTTQQRTYNSDESNTISTSSFSTVPGSGDKSHTSEKENTSDTATPLDNTQENIPSQATVNVKPEMMDKPGESPPCSPSTKFRLQKPGTIILGTSINTQVEVSKNDEEPVMIFTKSKLSPRKDKPQRTKDYSQISDVPKETEKPEVKKVKDIINPKDAKKIFETEDHVKFGHKGSNKVLSHRKFFDSNSKTADKHASEQIKKGHTKQQATAEVMKTPRSSLTKDHLPKDDKSKRTEVKPEIKSVKPVATRRTNVTKSRTAPDVPITVNPPSVSDINDTDTFVATSLTSIVKPSEEMLSNNSSLNITSVEESQTDEMHKDKTSTSKRSYPEDAPALNEQPLSKVSKDKPLSSEEPVKGIASIITQRLKKQTTDPSQVAEDVVSSSDEIIDEDLSDANIFSRKFLTLTPAKSSLDNSEKDSLSSEIENEIAAVRKKMEVNRSKSTGPAPIFDSSQLSKKRKENKKLQSSSSQGIVPPLDLSGITDDLSMEYQPQLQNVPPCNIVFIGENAKTSRSLLSKQRKIKINIYFNDAKTETFEYPSEESALEKYLLEHPHEKDEILVLENFGAGGDESSDDIEIDVFQTRGTPRGNTDEDYLKANTALAHPGSLQSYRGRFQQDYELGAILFETPEKPIAPEPPIESDKLMLRPADEDDTNTWSTSSSSDILF